MSADSVNSVDEWNAPAPRPATRYSTLARLINEEIASGRFNVGDRIPTEAELQQRFDVSRHTVREALRDLKTQGLVVARPGVGTVVRSRTPRVRFMQGTGTLRELIQFVEATKMRVQKKRRLIADESLAERIAVKPGQQWHEASVLRFVRDDPVPVALMRIYVRPEHADVLEKVDSSGLPVFSLIERHHGLRIAEVSQQIAAVLLDRAHARTLKARPGAPALEITRQYEDTHARMVMASVGIYPSDRFSHNTKFRIQNA
ncbi:MAG TPA: GntR family transcriptional regulator [Casimicrobiaceae bacterium]|nr:GntR family transcriptional regulator [Casimicrobiaceae bacterium]